MKPDYYKAGKLDVIAFCQHHNLGFAEGNIIKYVTRAGKKTENPLEDLKKAKEYLERLIQSEEVKWEELDAIKESIDKIKNKAPLEGAQVKDGFFDSNGVFNRYLSDHKTFSTPYDGEVFQEDFNTLLNQGYWHNTPIEETKPFLSKETIDAYAKQGLYFRWSDEADPNGFIK
jgi:hypothetical protein